ncbi:polygalacturonase At1g48100-like [Cucurbita moschata]|uniref:Polygalacturonase At1g48100-like n=1 Tax=Cucurbita moschata TaxID=3662 RepID=A0A6J1F9Z9_CUCMO|nr:polygalacturonase At1g48100-like [Cucurbita moschata]
MEMGGKNLKCLATIAFICAFVWSFSLQNCQAREGKHWAHRKTGGYRHGRIHRDRGGSGSSRLTGSGHVGSEDVVGASLASKGDASKGGSGNFNVLDFGAKGDGRADDTKAFQAAWESACSAEKSTVEVPSGSEFLVGPISFSGPNCKPNIVFQLDGKIIAPTSPSAWGSGLLQWIEFTKLKGITVKGTGTIDGQGSVWWNDSPTYDPTDENLDKESSSGKLPSTKPTALRFYGSDGVTVSGITIQNSQQAHLKFDSCTSVQVSSLTISSPGDSPNTDGIHLQNSQNVIISNSNLACGDDCISIQTGSSAVYIHNVNCGPGHGISIGGLGRDQTKACVSNVTVRDVKLQNTMNGVRIKTWQGGSGLVQGILFSNIQVSDVKTPIMIDQYYCDGGSCHNGSSAVAISGVNYVNIRGTYTSTPVHLACSDSLPCTGVTLDTIQLEGSGHSNEPFCWKAYGELKTSTVPAIDCLQSGNPGKAQAHDSC